MVHGVVGNSYGQLVSGIKSSGVMNLSTERIVSTFVDNHLKKTAPSISNLDFKVVGVALQPPDPDQFCSTMVGWTLQLMSGSFPQLCRILLNTSLAIEAMIIILCTTTPPVIWPKQPSNGCKANKFVFYRGRRHRRTLIRSKMFGQSSIKNYQK